MNRMGSGAICRLGEVLERLGRNLVLLAGLDGIKTKNRCLENLQSVAVLYLAADCQ